VKVQHAENNVLASSGLQDTTGFSIRASAHAFKILSSGLYSDKVAAVLREIGCNAMDAHIEAKTPDRPFLVKLPNRLDNEFYIQDWGPGLSHESVLNLYTTYFASTKQESNDYTGAFGLGSKSPFSYTDSFVVVSTHRGRKRTYTLYSDNKGMPTVSLLTEEDADPDWESGIRISFPVDTNDYAEFETKAYRIFRWFRVPPIVKGAMPVEPAKYRVQAPTYRLLDKEWFDANKPLPPAIAVMGNVAYPLVLDKLGKASPLAAFAGKFEGLVIPLDIGQAQVAASREELQYDPDTVKHLTARIDDAMRLLGNEIVTLIEAAEKGGWAELCTLKDRAEAALKGSVSYWNFAEFAQALGHKKDRAKELEDQLRTQPRDLPKLAGT
jgi:hypothetical protein